MGLQIKTMYIQSKHISSSCFLDEVVLFSFMLQKCYLCTKFQNFKITPFHLASITGNFAACKLIIDSVDDKNSYNFHDQSSSVSPLHFAAERGYYKICQLIINQIDNRNPEHFFTGFTPLHHAASNGHLKICQLILGRPKAY